MIAGGNRCRLQVRVRACSLMCRVSHTRPPVRLIGYPDSTLATATRRRSWPRGKTRPASCAGRRGDGLRARCLPPRLGARAGDLPHRAYQQQLAPAPQSGGQRPDRGHVLKQGLCAVPASPRLLPRARPLPPPDALPAPARAIRGAPGRPPACVDRRARRSRRAPRRDRGYSRPRHPPLPPAPPALARAAKSPARPHPRRDRTQLPPPRGMSLGMSRRQPPRSPFARLCAEPVAA